MKANPAVAKAMAGEGGEGEIRTREDLAALLVFKTSALDQLSDLSPNDIICISFQIMHLVMAVRTYKLQIFQIII